MSAPDLTQILPSDVVDELDGRDKPYFFAIESADGWHATYRHQRPDGRNIERHVPVAAWALRTDGAVVAMVPGKGGRRLVNAESRGGFVSLRHRTAEAVTLAEISSLLDGWEAERLTAIETLGRIVVILDGDDQ